MKVFFRVMMICLVAFTFFSCGTKSTGPEDGKVATPTFSPDGGNYDSATNVLISCATDGAIIRYTTDNTEPNSTSPQFSGFLIIQTNATLKAKAFKPGWISSPTKTATYTINSVLAPVMSPSGGSYTTPMNVSLFCVTEGAQIHYTTDGSTPTGTSAVYNTPIHIDANTTLQAKAYYLGNSPSSVTTGIYTMLVSTPAFTPAGSSYPIPQNVSIECSTANAQIYYTTDGSIPTETSNLYTHPLNVSSNSTIRAKAFKNGWTPSGTSTSTYLISITDQMVYVFGGTFNNSISNVTLSPYYIGMHEVTQSDWLFTMGTNPSYYPQGSDLPIPDLPVESVSWFDAVEYCNRRSVGEGYSPCYSYGPYGTNPSNWPVGWNTNNGNHLNITCDWEANGYRLPTEMEWMFAARGGNSSMNYIYSGSDNVDDVAWNSSNSEGITQYVGIKAANELGLYDMSGNVWEYCWDIFGPYSTDNSNNPIGADSGIARVIRGGCCLQDASNCTIARRFNFAPTIATNIAGFRVARNAQ